MQLAVSGGQHLFTLGLHMLSLSLVDSLSLLLSPSTNIEIFYFCQKHHLKDKHKIFKNARWFGIWMGFVDKYWLNWEFPPVEIFFSCLCDDLLGVSYTSLLVTAQWLLKRVPHLTSLAWVCVVRKSESSLELYALWIAHCTWRFRSQTQR